ncbi:hypothetical protein [Halomonas alimentaria]|uniref:Lipid/polyisoprenoid-binding YceI-like domain-containing protein n=1 Tax=Halomonas alimentaria TaxID=147248 RepID=A0A7X5APW0_9GAMM|nr:hypothetical protein [Halomonas alimentaria]NAW33456.1 hypothetical protein [Halomonas alimentaria]
MRDIGQSFCLALCAGVMTLASAQALANEIHGSLDGEEREWHVVTHAEGSTANYHELMPGMLNVTIQGHREEKFATQGTLSIDFMVMQGSPSAASVTYFSEASMVPHYGTETEVPIELEVLELEGDSGRAKGRVRTSLAYVESMQSSHDADNSIDLDVEFDVTLVREELEL